MSGKELYNGIVVRSTGSWASVRNEEGTRISCRIKGSFRMQGIDSTNPVAVGDKVRYHLEKDESGIISEILPRENYIIRKSTKLSKRGHILAANIDQAVLMATLAFPRTSTGFIDRFLVTAEAYHIPVVIVFNKLDLYDAALAERYHFLKEVYEKAGYQCLGTSALKGTKLEDFARVLKDKTSLLAGHSGVGKSALINAIQPDLKLKTGLISAAHQKGKHTTTFAEMFHLHFGGFIIDSPGIKEFGLIDFDRQEVGERFPEMRALLPQCRFNNCTHVHEPDCAVRLAVEAGEIALFRYENYLGILNDDYWEETENYE